MLRKLYDWTLSLSARKSAEWWLWIIAFVESSVFFIPAEVLFVPMGLARPERAYRYAVIATVGSVLGGIFGWYLGYYAYELIARPILEFYGSLERFEVRRDVDVEKLAVDLHEAFRVGETRKVREIFRLKFAQLLRANLRHARRFL